MTNEREAEWKDGYHTSSKGVRMKLSDMAAPHIQNAINRYGGDHDVSHLKKELDSRPKEV